MALDQIRERHAPAAVSAADLMHRIVHSTRVSPLGCASLDALLDGGVREGQVLELFGDSGAWGA